MLLLPNGQFVKQPFQKAAGSVSRPVVPVSPTQRLGAAGTGKAHVNELLEVLVEVREVVSTLLILGDELLLALLQLQPLLLERLPLDPLLVDACRHQGVLVGVGMLRVGGEELVDGDKGERLVCMAVGTRSVLRDHPALPEVGGGDVLERFARGYLPLQVALLVVQVLQLEVEDVDLVTGFGRLGLGVAGAEVGSAVQAAELSEVGVEQLLLLGNVEEDVGGERAVTGGSTGLGDEIDERECLIARRLGRLQDGCQGGIGDVVVDGHGRRRVGR